ncbi:MAG: hypothetical protein PHD03_01305 [Bacilli bacterium]|nr:hypothetical protein [Bacilli bacterium]MDD4406541.1 hypothetical protein [Bacilli bacterium]
MKKIVYTGYAIVIILVLGLTVIGLNLKAKNQDYYDLEKRIEESAKLYYSQFPDKFPSKETTITSDKLIEINFLKNMKLLNDECKGYVVVTKVYMYYEYAPYVKCKNYETKDFNDSILKEV